MSHISDSSTYSGSTPSILPSQGLDSQWYDAKVVQDLVTEFQAATKTPGPKTPITKTPGSKTPGSKTPVFHTQNTRSNTKTPVL